MTAQAAFDVKGVTRGIATLRLLTLGFSLPYVWLWTSSLTPLERWSAMLAHGLGLLAANTWIEVADSDRGLEPHLGPTRDASLIDYQLARLVSWPLAGSSVLASLGLVSLSAFAPVLTIALLASVWLATRLPNDRKYLVGPEIAAPVLLLLAPAAGLTVVADAMPPVIVTAAGACFLSALVIACHIRDRPRDLECQVPTLATRNLPLARGWMLTLAFAGTITACTALTTPLDAVEVARAAGALAFGVSATIKHGRVATLTVAHAFFAVTLLL